MNNPNDPYPQPPAQPPYGGPPPHQPYGGPSQPPYGAPGSGNSKLLMGIIAALLLVIVIGATLYFTGAFGGRRSSESATTETGDRLMVMRENVTGSWGTSGDCSSYLSEHSPNGDLWQANYTNAAGSTPNKNGTWRLEGNRLYHQLDITGVAEYYYTVNWVTRDAMNTTTDDGRNTTTWPRCPNSLSGGGQTAAAPAAPAPVAPQGQMSEMDLQAYLQQQAAQMQGQLPRQAGPITIQSVNASGFVMSIRATVPTNDWASIRSQLTPAICGSPAGAAVRSGARISIDMLHEASGSTDRMTVSSC